MLVRELGGVPATFRSELVAEQHCLGGGVGGGVYVSTILSKIV